MPRPRSGSRTRSAPTRAASPQVAHTTLLYAVDDTGHVVLAWPFGVSKDDLAADIDQLLDQQPAGGYE